MNHINHRHSWQNKKPGTSAFYDWVDVPELIDLAVASPTYRKAHDTKPGRMWYIKYVGPTSIGVRGTDGAECRWIAVLKAGPHTVTAYPIPHAHTLYFMRR